MGKPRIYTQVSLNGFLPDGRCAGFAGPRRIHAAYGMPGEMVDVQITGNAGSHLEGLVTRIYQASPDRTDPVCPHFGLCGGCSWQHASYESQLRMKRDILTSALARTGIAFPQPAGTVPSPSVYHYRHRMEFAFSARRWYHEGEGRVTDPSDRVAMGFHLRGNAGKVVAIDRCYLQPEPGLSLARALHHYALKQQIPYFDAKTGEGTLRSLVVRITSTGEVMAIVVFSENNLPVIRKVTDYLAGSAFPLTSLWYSVVEEIQQNYTEGALVHCEGTSPWISEQCNGLHFRITPAAFYQPNPQQAEAIFNRIRTLASLSGTELVYDLYCGIGTIALHLAGTARHVTGIDGSVTAIDEAIVNAGINGISNADFIAGDVLKTFTPGLLETRGRPDVVVLDPPRSGTLIEIKKTILAAAPPKIIYLSCDPRSLANDLRMLSQGYTIRSIEPFDQFPQTHHVETLVLLEKE